MPSVASTTGFLLIGLFANLVLFGVTVCQLWLLSTRFVRDPWGLKLVVALVACAETINTLTACNALYSWLVTHYGEAEYLAFIGPSFIGSMESGAISAFIVECFLAWRIHSLRHQWWLTAIIVFFAIGGIVGCTATMVGCGILKRFDALGVVQPAILVMSCCIVTCDLLETATLYTTLRRALTGFSLTDSRIAELKNLILQTSVLTLICDLCHMSIVATHPMSDVHLMFNLVSPKLVSNSLLSTLNTRRPYQNDLVGQEQSNQSTSRGSTTLVSSFRKSTKDISHWFNPPSAHSKTEHDTGFALSSLTPKRSMYGRSGRNGEGETPIGAVQITTVQERFEQDQPAGQLEQLWGVHKLSSEDPTPITKPDSDETSFRLAPAQSEQSSQVAVPTSQLSQFDSGGHMA